MRARSVTSGSGRREGSSRTCASRWLSPKSRVIRKRCCPVRARSCRPHTATTRPSPRSSRAKEGSRATRGTTVMPCCANGSTSSGARLGGEYRVLVDANQHVDREAAARSGVGFYGKNTMLITRRHGSWVVLGTLVTTADGRGDRHRSSSTAARARSASRRVRPERSTSRASSMRRSAFRTGRRRRRRSPRSTAPSSVRRSTAATSARTSVPGTAASRSAEPTGRLSEGAEPHVRLADWLRDEADARDGTLRPAVRPEKRRALSPAQCARRARQHRQRRRRAARAAVCSTARIRCCESRPAGRSRGSRSVRSAKARRAREGARRRARSRARAHATATCLRISSGSSSTASPRCDSTSPISHSALPTGISASAVPSLSGVAPRSAAQRAATPLR